MFTRHDGDRGEFDRGRDSDQNLMLAQTNASSAGPRRQDTRAAQQPAPLKHTQKELKQLAALEGWPHLCQKCYRGIDTKGRERCQARKSKHAIGPLVFVGASHYCVGCKQVLRKERERNNAKSVAAVGAHKGAMWAALAKRIELEDLRCETERKAAEAQAAEARRKAADEAARKAEVAEIVAASRRQWRALIGCRGQHRRPCTTGCWGRWTCTKPSCS